MSKVLVIFIVVLAGYLLFDKIASKDPSIESNEKVTIKPSLNSNKKSENTEAPYEVEPSDIPETGLFATEFIEASYAVELDNENIKATLRFSFEKDGSFRDYRDMTFPKSITGETTGSYVIEGAVLTLIYAKERDTNVFKFEQSEMTLQKDGTLKTGSIVLTKE